MHERNDNPTPQLVIVGHSNAITAVALSADGKTLVSGGCDRTAIVWNVETGSMQRLLPLREAIGSLALTPDGKTAVTDDGQVWDVASDTPLRKFRRSIGPLACSPDGKTLACATYTPDGKGWVILLSDIRTGRTKTTFAHYEFEPYSLAFSADGELVAANGTQTEGEEFTLLTIVCEIRTGKTRRVLPGKSVRLFGVDRQPNIRLASVTEDGTKIWNVEIEEILRTIDLEAVLRPFDRGLISTALSPDGRLLAIGTEQGYVMLWDISADRFIRQAQAHQRRISAVIFSFDAKILVTAGDDFTIHLWNVADGQLRTTLGSRRTSVAAAAFDPGGKSVIAVTGERTALFWNLETLQLQRPERKELELLERGAPRNSDTARNLGNIHASMLPDNANIYGIAAVSPDGSLVALYGPNETLIIWNTAAQKVQSTLLDAAIWWGNAHFSPDNRFVVISSGK